MMWALIIVGFVGFAAGLWCGLLPYLWLKHAGVDLLERRR